MSNETAWNSSPLMSHKRALELSHGGICPVCGFSLIIDLATDRVVCPDEHHYINMFPGWTLIEQYKEDKWS